MNRKISLLVAFGLLFSVGCSKLNIALSLADAYAMSYVTDYFDMTSEQKSSARSDFKKILMDVQTDDFPVYAKQLNQLADRFEKKEASPEVVRQFLSDAEKLIKSSMQRFEPLAQKIVKDQSQTHFQQFDEEILRKFNKDQKKFEDKSDFTKIQKKKAERWIDETIESLTDTQQKSLDQLIIENPAPWKTQLDSRRSVYEQFKVIRQDEKGRQAFIRKFFFEWESLQTPAYQKDRLVYQSRWRDWIIEMSQNLNDQQTTTLIGNLRKRAQELSRLSQK